MKIKTSYVPKTVSYLTVGKEYEVVSFVNNRAGYVRDDAGDTLLICFAKCAHLNGRDWEIVKDVPDDDLVGRLFAGDRMNGRKVDCTSDQCNCSLMDEAAHEILRLCKEVSFWKDKVYEND